MPRLLYVLPVILGLSAASLLGCGPDRKSQAITRCQTEHSGQYDPLVLLFGAKGVTRLCECTMTEVYTKLPDADRKVTAWLNAVNSTVENRGVLGAVRDSTWLSGRSSELATFATVYGRAWTECAVKATKP